MNTEALEGTKKLVCGKPKIWKDPPGSMMYCPGCHHPVIYRIISEVLEELNIDGKAICMLGVGCNSYIVGTWDIDMTVCAHGRALDAATSIQRLNRDVIVFTVQGDGDCTAIGAGAFINAMTRGEKLTTFMYNNTNYGTTGGQLAPTTLVGQKTTTSPQGRDAASEGYPIHAAELASTFKGTAYSARGSVHTPKNYQRTKRYIKKAFQNQLDGIGFNFVEVLSACPPNWHLTPVECLKRIEDELVPEFPLGEFKNEGN
jgi:2-oxoglutarate ferredoxin oxidoreductase subunit beta